MLINTEEHPIIISIVYYAAFLFAGYVLRSLVRRYTFVESSSRRYFLDLVSTFSVLACSLENSHVRQQYGNAGYVTILYILSTWHSFTLHDSNPNAIYNSVKYAMGRFDARSAVFFTTGQIIGMYLSYGAAIVFWSLSLCHNHRLRLVATECTTDLNVTVLVGFLVESVGTSFDILISLTRFTASPLFELSIKILINVVLTAAAVHLTGYYLNPLNASNQTFGCHGTTVVEHLFVYWFGPIVFAFITTRFVYPHFRRLFGTKTNFQHSSNNNNDNDNNDDRDVENVESDDDSVAQNRNRHLNMKTR